MPSDSARRPKAFVIIPFKEPFTSYYTSIFRPALESAGYQVERADDFFLPRPVMLDVQESILTASLLLCEMSGRNPNVFYELGIAHALGKPVVLVSRDEGDVPFDLRHIRVIVYDPQEPNWEGTLRERVLRAAEAVRSAPQLWPPPLVPQAAVAPPSTARVPRRDGTPAIDRPVNLGFDGPIDATGYPWGWFDSLGYVDGVSTEYSVTVSARPDGVPGACLKLSKASAGDDEFGSVMQRCPCEYLVGRTVRMQAEMSTEGIRGWAGLWFRIDGADRPNLFFDNMSRRRLSGTTRWSTFRLEAHVPTDGRWMNFGVVLSGSGTLWVDGIHLDVWDADGGWKEL